jgi:hypothetical protein
MDNVLLIITLGIIISLLFSIAMTYGKIWIDKLSGKDVKSTPVPHKDYQRDFE